MNGVAMLIHTLAVSGAKGNAVKTGCVVRFHAWLYIHAVTPPIHKRSKHGKDNPFNQGPQQITVLADVKRLF